MIIGKIAMIALIMNGLISPISLQRRRQSSTRYQRRNSNYGRASASYRGINYNTGRAPAYYQEISYNDGIAPASYRERNYNSDHLVACPANILTVTDDGESYATVSFNLPSTRGNQKIECLPESGSKFEIGTTEVTCQKPNSYRNYGYDTPCSFEVTVIDAETPSIYCPSDIMGTVNSGEAGMEIDIPVTTADDNVGVETLDCSITGTHFFPIGTTTVICTATDMRGNEKCCSFDVVISDETLPTIECPADMPMIFTDPGENFATVSFSAHGYDTNGNALVVSCSPSDNSYEFPLGDTVVTCSATDGGVTVTCSFTVTVSDVEPPSITCPPAQMFSSNTTEIYVTDVIVATASDNAGTVDVECSPSGDFGFAPGRHTIWCIATDAQGNEAFCCYELIYEKTLSVLDLLCDSDDVDTMDDGLMCDGGTCVSLDALPANDLCNGDNTVNGTACTNEGEFCNLVNNIYYFDHATANPCENNGTALVADCYRSIAGCSGASESRCHCEPGFTGPLCETIEESCP